MNLEYQLAPRKEKKKNRTGERKNKNSETETLATKMGTVTRSSSEVYTSDSEKGFAINNSTASELDAGAKFVLVSKGEGVFLSPCYITFVFLLLSFS